MATPAPAVDPKPAPVPAPPAKAASKKAAAKAAPTSFRVLATGKVSIPNQGHVIFKEGRVLRADVYGEDAIARFVKQGLRLAPVEADAAEPPEDE